MDEKIYQIRVPKRKIKLVKNNFNLLETIDCSDPFLKEFSEVKMQVLKKSKEKLNRQPRMENLMRNFVPLKRVKEGINFMPIRNRKGPTSQIAKQDKTRTKYGIGEPNPTRIGNSNEEIFNNQKFISKNKKSGLLLNNNNATKRKMPLKFTVSKLESNLPKIPISLKNKMRDLVDIVKQKTEKTNYLERANYSYDPYFKLRNPKEIEIKKEPQGTIFSNNSLSQTKNSLRVKNLSKKETELFSKEEADKKELDEMFNNIFDEDN